MTEALNAVYAKEDSSLDPVIERMMAMALVRQDWWILEEWWQPNRTHIAAGAMYAPPAAT